MPPWNRCIALVLVNLSVFIPFWNQHFLAVALQIPFRWNWSAFPNECILFHCFPSWPPPWRTLFVRMFLSCSEKLNIISHQLHSPNVCGGVYPNIWTDGCCYFSSAKRTLTWGDMSDPAAHRSHSYLSSTASCCFPLFSSLGIFSMYNVCVCVRQTDWVTSILIQIYTVCVSVYLLRQQTVNAVLKQPDSPTACSKLFTHSDKDFPMLPHYHNNTASLHHTVWICLPHTHTHTPFGSHNYRKTSSGHVGLCAPCLTRRSWIMPQKKALLVNRVVTWHLHISSVFLYHYDGWN